MTSHTRLKDGTYAQSIAESVISPTVHPPRDGELVVAVRVACAQGAVVDESVELTLLSVPRGAESAIAEKTQPLVGTAVSLKIPLSWSCGQVPRASGFGETPGLHHSGGR